MALSQVNNYKMMMLGHAGLSSVQAFTCLQYHQSHSQATCSHPNHHGVFLPCLTPSPVKAENIT